jgi:hypothetical protein
MRQYNGRYLFLGDRPDFGNFVSYIDRTLQMKEKKGGTMFWLWRNRRFLLKFKGLGKESIDVIKAIVEAVKKRSPGGRNITKIEWDGILLEVEDVIDEVVKVL